MTSNSSAIAAAAAFLLALTLAMSHSVALAQNNPVDFLRAHNHARRRVGLPVVAWDKVLEIQAQNEAALCAFTAGPTPPTENHLWVAGSGVYHAGDAVALWVAEEKNYNRFTGSCAAPAPETCEHYTRVVSVQTERIGCAREVCQPGFGGSPVYYFICKYAT